MTASVARKPCTRSKSSPGVRMVTASGAPPSRISRGSSAATVSGRVLCTVPRMRSTGVRLVTRPTGTNGTHAAGLTVQVMDEPVPLPPYAAVVLAGGRAARLGGQAKPQLEIGGGGGGAGPPPPPPPRAPPPPPGAAGGGGGGGGGGRRAGGAALRRSPPP